MNNLGWFYHNGWGVIKDDQQAIKWYQKAADAGNLTAMNNLGRCYYNGWGVAKDDQQAVKWIRKAAELGSEPAKAWLAEHKLAP